MPASPDASESPSGASGASGTSTSMTIGKVFGNCDKLNKDNYEVWLAGLISALTGLTVAYDFFAKLEKALRYLKTAAHMTIETVTEYIGEHILSLVKADRDRKAGTFLVFNTQLYHVLNSTISETLVNMKKTIAGSAYFEDGLKVMLYFFEQLGPGDKTTRTGTRINLLKMTQTPEESVREFGDRMKLSNDSLVKPIEDETLVVVFSQGCYMHDIRHYLAGKMAEKDYSLDGIINLADQYYKNLDITSQNNIDGLQAGVTRGRGKGQGGRPNHGGRGRGAATREKRCDVCENLNHYWRGCFYVNWLMRRPNTTEDNHNKLDQKCEEFLSQRSPVVQKNVRAFQQTLEPRPKQIQGALADARIEFPDVVDGKMALVGTPANNVDNAQASYSSDYISDFMRYMIIFTKGLLALLMSSGGIILLLSLVLQFKLAGATATELPRTPIVDQAQPLAIKVDMPVDTKNTIRADAFPAALRTGKANGTAWDSCAGHNLFPFTNHFHAWDTTPKKYTVHGISGSVPSTGSGFFSVGFLLDDQSIEWYDDAHGLFVPGLGEPLMSAVWFAANLGIYTSIEESCFIRMQSGAYVPCQTQGNTLRCKRIVFGNGTRMRGTVRATPARPLKVAPSVRAPTVDAQAAQIVSTSRGKQGAEADDLNFRYWTRVMCGLAPRSVQQLKANTVGTNCPADIPPALKDLKWNPSAVAGKQRASSHPSVGGKRAEHFRDAGSMDWLEFTLEIRGKKKKFHGHAFIDHATTAAHIKCSELRTARSAVANTLWYLNHTDKYSRGQTIFYVQHDRACEFLSSEFEKSALYSGIVQFLTAPYVHQQNGLVERYNQTLQRMVIVIMHDSNVPGEYTIYAIEYASGIYNVVPVESFGWRTRHELMTGSKPDVSGYFRFGCLLKMLKPLEIRCHKFDVHAEDYVNLGPCPRGRGTRALCVRTKRVHVRDDVVCYPDVMPFRSMGGSRVHDKLAAEVAPSITWDPDGTDTPHNQASYQMQDAQPSTPPSTPVTVDMPANVARRQLSVAPSLHLSTAANTPTSRSHNAHPPDTDVRSGNSIASEAYSPYYAPTSPIGQPKFHVAVSHPTKPSLDERHGTVSTRTERGEWARGHCSNSGCTLGAGHSGPCSNITVEPMEGKPAQATRGARMRAIQESPEDEVEAEIEAAPNDDSDDSAIDALLATSYSISSPQMLNIESVQIGESIYGTCIDALSSSVDLEELNLPTGKGERAGPMEFDLSLPVPNTIDEAMASDNWSAHKGYEYAVKRECDAWIKQKVLKGTSWDQIKQDLHALNMRCLFSVKTDKKNRFQRAKLRIIILGHQHAAKQGEHYFENFSQTARWPNIRAMCAQACINGFTFAKQVDTGAAFLFEENERGTQVLVNVPPELGKILGCGELAFCLKAAYGLPSAPRAFFNFVKRTLTDSAGCNFRQSRQDEAVFYCIEGNDFCFIGTWVDDFIILGNSHRLYERFTKYYGEAVGGALEEGDLDFMLGVNFDVNLELQTIKLYSEKAINKLLQKYGTPTRPSQVPALENAVELIGLELPVIGSPEYLALRKRAERYRSLVPAILYVVTTVRADCAWITGVLCQCLDNPTERHCDAAEIELAYLMTTINHGLCYGGDHVERLMKTVYSPLKDGLTGLSDSNWLVHRSISAFLIYLAGALILWASKRQPVTSLSSTEAEYYAASSCGAEVVAMRYFLAEITGNSHPLPTPIYVDNSACVNLAKDFNSCKRTKHIDRRIHFLTDYQKMGEIQLIYIATAKNTADALTKPLAKHKFLEHRSLIVRESAAWGGVRVDKTPVSGK